MNHQFSELKFWLFNGLLIGVSFTNIELALKIISLLLAIGYTAHRWWLLHKNNKKNNHNDEI